MIFFSLPNFKYFKRLTLVYMSCNRFIFKAHKQAHKPFLGGLCACLEKWKRELSHYYLRFLGFCRLAIFSIIKLVYKLYFT